VPPLGFFETEVVAQKKCGRKHPPGKKVYQRGAHTIWEVDGAKDKVRCILSDVGTTWLKDGQLYCQNLSLFGKLFIDIKTLFFDTDNCRSRSFPRPPSPATLSEMPQFFST
jgi:hypothetical protein